MLYNSKFKKTAPTNHPFSQGIHHEFIFKPSQSSSGKFQAFYFLSVNWAGFGIGERHICMTHYYVHLDVLY